MDSLDAANIDSQQLSESIAVDEFLCNLKNIDLKRVKAFNALSGEREYQECLHKKTGQDPIPIPGELLLMYSYLQKAIETYTETFGDPGEKPTMDVIRKITAIGLRALENYGCPYRDIEGSLAARPPEHRAKDFPRRPNITKDTRIYNADLHVEDMCAYPLLRKNAECQACNIGECEFDLRPPDKKPGPGPDLSEIDGADQG